MSYGGYTDVWVSIEKEIDHVDNYVVAKLSHADATLSLHANSPIAANSFLRSASYMC